MCVQIKSNFSYVAIQLVHRVYMQLHVCIYVMLQFNGADRLHILSLLIVFLCFAFPLLSTANSIHVSYRHLHCMYMCLIAGNQQLCNETTIIWLKRLYIAIARMRDLTIHSRSQWDSVVQVNHPRVPHIILYFAGSCPLVVPGCQLMQ